MNVNDIFKAPSGSVLMIMHKGGKYNIETNTIDNGDVIAKKEIKNLIVNEASRLMAIRMAPGSLGGHLDTSGVYVPGITTGEYEASGLKYLSMGVGKCMIQTAVYDETNNPVDTVLWPLQNPPVETITTSQLVGELKRKKFTDWKYLDVLGNLSSTPTNILLLSTTFLESESVGPLTEMGLYGGDGATDNRNTGHLFNYKTFKVWNKPNDARLTIVWKLTF
jgi:hypothetical protein